jgi:D-alanine-D-alanine ligase
MKVAVVHNGNHEGVIHRFGRPCPERYNVRHVQMVVDALHQQGHTVAMLEADVTLFEELRRFFSGTVLLPASPPVEGWGDPQPGMVFNMAYGIQGDARYTHLPAMLELAGLPYTGSNPLGHALALDKVITKILMTDAGVPTPAYRVMNPRRGPETADGRTGNGWNRECRFPLVVKPRHESTSCGLRFVSNQRELTEAVEAITQEYQQEALVEEYIEGCEVCIGLLGNDPVEFFPPVELDFGDRDLRLMTLEDKLHHRMDEPLKVCPAPLDTDMLQRLNQLALATFRACHLRDYARVDIRIDPQGHPFVLEINSMASLGNNGSYITASRAAGYDFAALVNRILKVAHQRSFNTAGTRLLAPDADATASDRVITAA